MLNFCNEQRVVLVNSSALFLKHLFSQVMPGQMVAPGGAPPPQQAVLVQGQVDFLLLEKLLEGYCGTNVKNF